VPCLDEDTLTDLAAGRLRLDTPGIEEHLETCPACVRLLGLAAAAFGTARPDDNGDTAVTESTRTDKDVQAIGALAPGTVLKGTYVVLRPIGRGGMGEVYEVSHVRLAGRYAVKVLRPEVSRDEELLTRFKREAEITSALRHPNIIQIIDFDRTTQGRVFLAMEFLEGRDLSALLKASGRLPLPRVLRLVGQVVSALSAAHRRGIVHRDLKPANVFVVGGDTGSRSSDLAADLDEHVKLMDFGLSKWNRNLADSSVSLSHDQALIGTPRYMAPEQAQGKNRDVGPAADQFALGAMVYEMLTGSSPFLGATLAEVLYAIVFQPPVDIRQLRPDLPAHLGLAIHRALAKSPPGRFPSVHDFFRALEGPGELAGVQRPLQRRRWIPLALAGAGTALAGALLLSSQRMPQPLHQSTPAPTPERAPRTAESPPSTTPAQIRDSRSRPTTPPAPGERGPAVRDLPRPRKKVARQSLGSAAARDPVATPAGVSPTADAAAAGPATVDAGLPPRLPLDLDDKL
jgi:serine/threonine protein kinase